MRFPDFRAGRVSLPASGDTQAGLSVLVIGELPELLSALRRGWGNRRMFIETAASLEAAARLRQRFHFDLIITRFVDSASSVSQWMADLRQPDDSAHIILIADSLDTTTALAAMRAGASDLLATPFDLDEIHEAIARVLDKAPAADLPQEPATEHGEVFGSDGIVGASPAMGSLCQVVKRVAPMPTTVLIEGESGTGKELVARAIHRLSRRKGNFAAINCGAITAELFESELFGHTKGSFTGALQARDGLMSYAEGGTVFLDEIGELPSLMQAKLLRVLEQRTIRPVGSNREVPVDIRVIAATNRNLALSVDRGEFREDLYHRLNVVALRVPPLRERPDDIQVLGHYFLQGISSKMGVQAPPIGDSEWLRLREYSWPGNVRELRNMIERCVLLNRMPSACLDGDAAEEAGIGSDPDDLSLESVERRHILAVLELSSGNKSEAARRLGISRKTLERKLRRWSELHQ